MQKEIGAIAKPRQVMIVPELPKTRSGKIMRRLLKDVAEHREVGDVTTLADSSVMDLIKEKEGSTPEEVRGPTCQLVRRPVGASSSAVRRPPVRAGSVTDSRATWLRPGDGSG